MAGVGACVKKEIRTCLSCREEQRLALWWTGEISKDRIQGLFKAHIQEAVTGTTMSEGLR
jgi:hypothetical protein